MIAPLPLNEAGRLKALQDLNVLDTVPEPEYDDLTRIAGYICETPIVAVSLIDRDRQWFKSQVGLDVTETPRNISFCAHAILGNGLFEVADASADERFRDNPLVTGKPYIRFYASVPLTTPEGFNVGSLCVIDHKTRSLTSKQADALGVLARQVVAKLLLKRQVGDLERELAERLKAEEALRANEAKFRNTLELLTEGVYLMDNATGSIIGANRALLNMLGYTEPYFCTLRTSDIMIGESQELILSPDASVTDGTTRHGCCHLGDRQYRRKDGTLVDVDVKLVAIPDGGQGLTSVIVRDITEERRFQRDLEQANTRLQVLAVTDGLTGLRNRREFDKLLAEVIDRALRYDRPLSLMLIDLDHFSQINNEFGHPAGDDVLRGVARVLSQSVRSCDLVARVGGEEFAVIVPDTELDGALVLAERCRQAIAELQLKLRPVTASFGVATLGEDVRDSAALIRQADTALYAAKAAGRNRVHHEGQGHLGGKRPRTRLSGTVPKTEVVRT